MQTILVRFGMAPRMLAVIRPFHAPSTTVRKHVCCLQAIPARFGMSPRMIADVHPVHDSTQTCVRLDDGERVGHARRRTRVLGKDDVFLRHYYWGAYSLRYTQNLYIFTDVYRNIFGPISLRSPVIQYYCCETCSVQRGCAWRRNADP